MTRSSIASDPRFQPITFGRGSIWRMWTKTTYCEKIYLNLYLIVLSTSRLLSSSLQQFVRIRHKPDTPGAVVFPIQSKVSSAEMRDE